MVLLTVDVQHQLHMQGPPTHEAGTPLGATDGISGSCHLLYRSFYSLSCLRTQSKVVQLTVMPTVRSSARFAHSESILMAMLCSEEREEREFAIDKIVSIRGEK